MIKLFKIQIKTIVLKQIYLVFFLFRKFFLEQIRYLKQKLAETTNSQNVWSFAETDRTPISVDKGFSLPTTILYIFNKLLIEMLNSENEETLTRNFDQCTFYI